MITVIQCQSTKLNFSHICRFLAAQQSNNQSNNRDMANTRNSSETNSTRPTLSSPRSEEQDDDDRITLPRTIKQYVTVHLRKSKKSLGM